MLRSCASVLLSAWIVSAGAQPADPLELGFKDPPNPARPRVWWHWMNGNIAEQGIRLDLEWMQRVGLGGAQVFEAGLPTPAVVEHPLSYLSPEWMQAFRFATRTARDLGLELTITTSPGWSETGGPWVLPADGMKKMVWSETRIKGGRAQHLMLATPPTVAGPFLDVPLSSAHRGAPDDPANNFYRDALVIAYPAQVIPLAPLRASDPKGIIETGLLTDGRFAAVQTLPSDHGSSWVTYEFAGAVTARSVRIGLPGPRGFGAPPAPLARLQASDDGVSFQTLTELNPSSSPVRSASFPAKTARFFRVLIESPGGGFMNASQFPPGVAVPAFLTSPAPAKVEISEFDLFSQARVHAAEEKAGFATVPDYYAVAGPSALGEFKAGDVIDLTRDMRPDGSLTFSPPDKRDWTVLRIGYSLTGHRNGPAPQSATGLEVDKLDASRVRQYLNTYLARYQDALGTELSEGPIQALLSDSIESGPQNWTDDILGEFKRLRGYDPKPYLPALTGVIVGDSKETERFLFDYRRTLSQLIADAHYGVIAEEAHRRGLKYYAEALEDHRPQLGDDLEMRRHADFPMGAMWMIDKGGSPRATYVADLEGAASVANVYGKPLVAAESMTAFAHPWGYSPRDLKSTADLEMALGVNQFAIHESAHQPLKDWRPGLALSVMLGQYFNRNDTWAEQAKAWISYLSRSCFLLQQGQHVADIAYFYGEEAPLTGLYGDGPVEIPEGHGFDFVGADALLNRLEVRDGKLSTPEGQTYRLLYLGGSSRFMTLAVLRKLAEFAEAGLVIVGDRPQASPSLADDPSQVDELVNKIWQRRDTVRGSLTEGLKHLSLMPDWSFDATGARLAVLHRRVADTDIYFVSNRQSASIEATLTLRVSGKSPEIFHADSGRIELANFVQHDGLTSLPVHLDPDDAFFVVFRAPTEQLHRVSEKARTETVKELNGPWRLSFDGPNPPPPANDARLGSWSRVTDPAQRYFSGTGSYVQTLRLNAREARAEEMDLGVVDELAELIVNGHVVGTLWKYPYRARIAGLLHAGDNKIEVRVTNLWVNRLIGDAQPGATSATHITDKAYLPEAPLRDSGLSGPVRLLKVKPANAR